MENGDKKAAEQEEAQPETAPVKKYNSHKQAGDVGTELYFWAQALTFALLVLVCLNTWFFRLSGVRGTSMVPTFHNGDQVIMRVIDYEQPKRGDIVVIKSDYFPDEPLVKRVVALEGDTVSFDYESGMFLLNGEAQYEPYISEAITRFGNQEYPLVVPEGCVFVMGDNRNGSTDSRWCEVGALPMSHIVGKVVLRIWPITGFKVVS